MKKYILISDFCLTARNRGTAALGYGSLSFLCEKGFLSTDNTIASYSVRKSLFSKVIISKKNIQGFNIEFYHIEASIFEYGLWKKFGISFSCFPWGRFIRQISCVAAINGGDGFSDIYGEILYKTRLPYMQLAMKINAPLVILPQTIGPFKDSSIFNEAIGILKYAKAVYVRDNKFTEMLNNNGVKYELTNDLSAYMIPEPWEIEIEDGAIGINISGLAYDNKFTGLEGQFDYYPQLMMQIVKHFQTMGKPIYLIPHAYDYNDPEVFNDDLTASRDFYSLLGDKSNVILIDEDLISPKVKYVISKMSFFIGTRMHANFAAIFTKVPLFGLAYSYKFQGAFENNGIFNRTAMINNISSNQISSIVNLIDEAYKEDVLNKQN